MYLKKVLVTGEAGMLARQQLFCKAMSPYFEKLECLPSGQLYEGRLLNLGMKVLAKINALVSPSKKDRYWKNERAFITLSQRTERQIRQLEYVPDLVFHFYCTYSPFWDKFDIPYVMYLDYTMALAKRTWQAWAPFNNQKEFDSWVDCERKVYERAHHLFAMGNFVKSSLVEDYGIKPENITVVGYSGNFEQPYEGEKTFGSKQILLNGSDWERKGGDLVLAAFKQVKKAIPEATLVILGKKLLIQEDGVINPGPISDFSEMRNLFLKTDLVVATARCDPFPRFVMEAMNYGVPCIVSAIDGMPEIIDDKVNGIVIEQLTPDVLAHQITNLLSDIPVLTSMSQNARDKVKNKFNWNALAKNISQVLSS